MDITCKYFIKYLRNILETFIQYIQTATSMRIILKLFQKIFISCRTIYDIVKISCRYLLKRLKNISGRIQTFLTTFLENYGNGKSISALSESTYYFLEITTAISKRLMHYFRKDADRQLTEIFVEITGRILKIFEIYKRGRFTIL